MRKTLSKEKELVGFQYI